MSEHKDEAEGGVELDGEDVDDDERWALANAIGEDANDILACFFMAWHHAVDNGEQCDAKAYDRQNAAAEGRGEQTALGW